MAGARINMDLVGNSTREVGRSYAKSSSFGILMGQKKIVLLTIYRS